MVFLIAIFCTWVDVNYPKYKVRYAVVPLVLVSIVVFLAGLIVN